MIFENNYDEPFNQINGSRAKTWQSSDLENRETSYTVSHNLTPVIITGVGNVSRRLSR